MSQSRRDFLKVLGSAGIISICYPSRCFAGQPPPVLKPEAIQYQYRTISVQHLREVQETFDHLNREGRISRQKTIQGYVKDLEFEPPKELPNARSLIVVATPWKLRSVGVRWRGKDHLLLIPGGYFYYEDGPFRSALKERIRRDVLKNSGASLQFANPPLKTLAVRSGLAEYGRNNIAYVDGYGSFHVLWAFFAGQELPDQWARPYRTMRLCKGCSVCTRACTTGAFAESNFVLDAGRCVSTYNELRGAIPGWVDARTHNALIGCLRCQFTCPANRELVRNFDHVADLSESETELLLGGSQDAKLEASIAGKLAGLGEWYAKDMKYLGRNIGLALNNAPNFEVIQ